jgi:hypothetical protein
MNAADNKSVSQKLRISKTMKYNVVCVSFTHGMTMLLLFAPLQNWLMLPIIQLAIRHNATTKIGRSAVNKNMSTNQTV